MGEGRGEGEGQSSLVIILGADLLIVGLLVKNLEQVSHAEIGSDQSREDGVTD